MVNATTDHTEVGETQTFSYPRQAPTIQSGPIPWSLGATEMLGLCGEHGRKTVMFSKQVTLSRTPFPKSCQFEQD